MKKKKIKKPTTKSDKSFLNLLIPDHLKRINKNSEWCKTPLSKKDLKKSSVLK